MCGPPDLVPVEHRIRRDKGQTVELCLRDQQPVERIAVVPREGWHLQGVRVQDCERLDSTIPQPSRHVVA